MSFYGLVILFVFLIVAAYLGAFFAELRYESSMNLAFQRCGSLIKSMSYPGTANLTGAGQAYVNYTLAADGMAMGGK